MRRALFELVAAALCEAPLSPVQQASIGELGANLERLESDPSDQQARAGLQQHLQQISGPMQPALAPLLVWLALAARRSRRGTALMNSVTDNLIAWSAARRAARGRFRLQ
jgi:hypothetical protein